MMGESILRITDNLAKALQNSQLTASDGQDMAQKTIDHLQSMRTDDAFQVIFDAAGKTQHELGMNCAQ